VDVLGREENELISFDEVHFLFCSDSCTVRTVVSFPESWNTIDCSVLILCSSPKLSIIQYMTSSP
jgi:hypothetical protein